MQSSTQIQTQIRMTIWTAALVLLFGGVVALTLLQPPKTIHFGEATNASRGPASINQDPLIQATTPEAKSDHQAIDLSLPCDKPKEGETSLLNKNVVQIRLTSACATTPARAHHTPQREIASTDIRNQANGFSATVFPQGPDGFTTDYISLAPGENHIHISQVMKSGERQERDLVLVRQKE